MGSLDDVVRKRLTKLRTDRKLTQERAGAVVGWTQTAVSKFELGDFSADLDTLVAFAEFYDVPVADLLSAQGVAKPADPLASALRDACARLTDDQKRALLVMLDAAGGRRTRVSGAARRSVTPKRTPRGSPPS